MDFKSSRNLERASLSITGRAESDNLFRVVSLSVILAYDLTWEFHCDEAICNMLGWVSWRKGRWWYCCLELLGFCGQSILYSWHDDNRYGRPDHLVIFCILKLNGFLRILRSVRHKDNILSCDNKINNWNTAGCPDVYGFFQFFSSVKKCLDVENFFSISQVWV